jgi:hypothetical protein
MQQFAISHRGVPIGTVDLSLWQQQVAVAVTPLPAYESIRALVRTASQALREAAVSSQPDVSLQAALNTGAQLGRDLELRDEVGDLVPTDFIELTEWPDETPEVRAWIGLRAVPTGKGASYPPRTTGGSGAAPAA